MEIIQYLYEINVLNVSVKDKVYIANSGWL